MKNGKSYLFNFFNEETNNDFIEFLKSQKIQVIRKVNEYFKKEEYPKKWKEEKISTFDYLLLLNKMSSRTYNDPNQYLIMPWPFLVDGINSKRNFDLPISVQDKDRQVLYLSNKNFALNETTVTQGNHYSTSAYIFFYLMRTNPFTNAMIKFQSKAFDVPDRQYNNMKHTIYLCQKMNNNREIIPELFNIPEIYINLNYNDFGKQKDGVRVHNVFLDSYAKNHIEFCYILKYLINNDAEINNNINKWFDFIFGVNQIGNYISNNNDYTKEDKSKLQLLRKFNSYCYGQNYNIKKLYLEAKWKNKTPDELYNDIKNCTNISIGFGQCPFQLLTEVHPSKNLIIEKENKKSLLTTIDENDYNKNLISNDKNTENNKIIYELKFNEEISYFIKSVNNNYLYCLTNNMNIAIFKINKIKNEYTFIKTISPKKQFLFLNKNQNTNFIFKPKYTFCELGENSFIFCRTLDKTLIYINEDSQTSFLLKSYTTCIKKVNNSEFITGHANGIICKWRIDFLSENFAKPELKLLLIIKSNKNPITCLEYNEKLNIILSCDNNTFILHKNYDFEYLNSIKIKNENNLKKYIVDVKISDYELIYVCIYIENYNIYELQGYTLNGTYFGKYEGNISNFEFTKTGKIIISEINKSIIKIIDPVQLNEIYSKINIDTDENNYPYFIFEKPNILYYGLNNNSYSKIKIFYLEQDEEKYFL